MLRKKKYLETKMGISFNFSSLRKKGGSIIIVVVGYFCARI